MTETPVITFTPTPTPTHTPTPTPTSTLTSIPAPASTEYDALIPVHFDRRMRNFCLEAPLLKYNRVEDLIERLLEAKHNVHKSVRNFLQNVFTQKIVASSDKFSGWTEYDSLILGNLSPRSVQKLTFDEIHTVLLNDLSERTLLWVARVNQELMQTLHTAINTAAFTGFQVLSTRIRGRDIISPHFKTLDESVLRAAENVINNFFHYTILTHPRKEEHNRSKSLFIDSYSNR